jgi:uncharacterized protein (TIGR02099 family)
MFSRLGRWVLQIAAGLAIVLALLVGVLRLLLPEASSFTEDIKTAVRERSGYQIDFEFISAGLSIYGPELRFLETTLRWEDGQRVGAAEQVAIALDLYVLVTEGRLVPGRVYIEGASVDALISQEGELLLQGRPISDYLPAESTGFDPDAIPEGRLQLVGITFSFQNMQRQRPPITGIVQSFELSLDDNRINVSGELEPGGDLGAWLDFQAELPIELLFDPEQLAQDTPWQLQLYAEDFRLDPWLQLAELGSIPVIDSSGTVDAKLEFLGLDAVSIATDLDLQMLQLAQPLGPPVMIDALEGRLGWQRNSDGWSATGEGLTLGRGDRVWPESSFSLHYQTLAGSATQSILLNASFARIDDLMPFAKSLAAEQLGEAGIKGEIAGDVENLSLDVTLVDGKPERFEVAVDFNQLAYLSTGREYDISGISGSVQATQDAGNLTLKSEGARLGMFNLFRDVIDLQDFEGVAIWRATDEGYRVLANGLKAVTPHGGIQASFELEVDAELQEPHIDLNAQAHLDDIGAVRFYVPKILPPDVIDWLDNGLLGGRVPHADLVLRGPLSDFPFDKADGEFVINIDFEGGVLDYAPRWPLVKEAAGRLTFDSISLYSTQNEVKLSGVRMHNIELRMADMRTGVIELKAAGPTELDKLLSFVQQTPVGESLGPVFAEIGATGDADVSAQLHIPVKNMEDWELLGELNTVGAEVWMAGIEPHFTDLTGTARIRNTQITATDISATLLDEPVVIEVRPLIGKGAEFSHEATVTGVMPTGKIGESFGTPYLPWFSGASPIKATALFPLPGEESAPFRILLESRLDGVTSLVPHPLSKAAEDFESVQVQLLFPDTGVIDIRGAAQRGVNWTLRMVNQGANWGLERGHIVSGGGMPVMPAEPGVRISGYIDTINVTKWVSTFTNEELNPQPETDPGSDSRWQDEFSQADLQIGELIAVGHRFVDVDARVDFNESAWDIYVAGPWAEGRIKMPYRFDGDAPLELAMERLLLIEPYEEDEEESSDYPIDPRDLPAIRGSVDEFALGNFRLGRLDIDIRRRPDGLRSRVLKTQSKSFTTEMSTDWSVVDNAQRSRLHLQLTSTDMEDTLIKLGYTPLLTAESGSVSADLLWEGGPGMAIAYESTGTVEMEFRDGVVTDVDPAGGRLLGLLSVTQLPRRLSLDFSDMVGEGLEFARLGGTFRIDFGDAWTCNLGLEGQVADMGIVGRAGLLVEDYDQVAVVRPHVSNLAPVSAAFLAGPAVGAAALLITQIFKKPLSGIGESYFTITGSWDDPVIEPVHRNKLDTTNFADCETQLPELSPEEIQAIEELLAEGNADDAARTDPAEPPFGQTAPPFGQTSDTTGTPPQPVLGDDQP